MLSQFLPYAIRKDSGPAQDLMTRFQQNISQEESNQSPVSIYGRFCQQRLKVPSTIQMGSIRFDHVCISLRGVIGAVSRTTTAILFLLQCRRRGNSILLRHSHIHLCRNLSTTVVSHIEYPFDKILCCFKPSSFTCPAATLSSYM
jgi:hypothetical protein